MQFSSVSELLSKLIQIPSVNPENDPGTSQVGEKAIAHYLGGMLSSLGAQVEYEEVFENRPNLIARFQPLDGRPRILFGPHLDTVGVGGMTIEPFSGELHDGKIWGRGASDTKGSIAAMIWAMSRQVDRLKNLPVAIDFVGFMGEEGHQWGSKSFAQKYAKEYQFAVIGEPTNLDVVCWTKGSTWLKLIANGKAAHSSMPENGENAVLFLIEALLELNQKMSQNSFKGAHAILGETTLNIGKIEGGSRPNIVPDRAESLLDFRTTPDFFEKGNPLFQVNKLLEKYSGKVSCEQIKESLPMATDSSLPGVQALLSAGEGKNKCVGAPWFSDAAHLAAVEIPAVCCGPGSILQAHTQDEFIAVEDLERGAEFFEKFLIAAEAWV